MYKKLHRAICIYNILLENCRNARIMNSNLSYGEYRAGWRYDMTDMK